MRGSIFLANQIALTAEGFSIALFAIAGVLITADLITSLSVLKAWENCVEISLCKSLCDMAVGGHNV